MHLRFDSLASVLSTPPLWAVALRAPWGFSGAALHRAGLTAMSAGRCGVADRLFERAAHRYRREIRTEALARLRVHQLMTRARAAGDPGGRLCLEVERALTRLDRIESPEPPFEVVPAHSLLATWLAEPDVGQVLPRPARGEPGRLSA